MRPTPVNLEQHDTFKRAVDLMQNTRANLFITGKAGTGKSTLLDHFILNTEKNAVVLAPTGVAALNVRGQTIHRFFGFYVDITPEKMKSKKDYRPRNVKVMGKLDTLIIDEISMVRADILDCVDAALRLYGPAPGTPFGGVQMIFVGDLYQLPPVVGRDEGVIFEQHYSSPYFFSARAMQDATFELIELDKVYRQKDHDFVELLNRIRNNTVTDNDLKVLNTRVLGTGPSGLARGPLAPNVTGPSAFAEGQQSITLTLTSTNAAADAVNNAALNALPGRAFRSLAEVSGDFTKDYYPTAPDLTFKIGAQIMMLNNDTKNRWVNGTMGIITTFDTDEDGNDYVGVQLEGSSKETKVYPFLWEVFKFRVVDNQIASEAVGTFSQFPFRLAWAVTIHKSQGKTFDHVVVDIGRGAFATGQVYVALSRCTSFEGLWLKTPIQKSHIRTDHRISAYLTNDAYKKADRADPSNSRQAKIEHAIAEKRAIKITYLKPDDTRSSRIINPLSIGEEEYKGKTFIGLRAFCRERNDNRIFRIDRILQIDDIEDLTNVTHAHTVHQK
jgi:ATP-dependent DNA helicase PIF1